jgi:hypothetical protein
LNKDKLVQEWLREYGGRYGVSREPRLPVLQGRTGMREHRSISHHALGVHLYHISGEVLGHAEKNVLLNLT